MIRSINFCFFAVGVAVILMMCANGTQGDQFSVTAQEMLRIYGDSSVSRETKYVNLERLAEFYEKYRDRIPFHEYERQWADRMLLKYKQWWVDGVPLQGGSVGGSINHRDLHELEFILKRLTSSAAGVKINRGTALFGLASIITCYVLGSM